MASLLTGKPIRNDVAMTGEITLRGLVLPVGGIKEKFLAAHRAGIKRVILPERNRKDVIEIPEKPQNEIEILFVKRMDEVLALALKDPPPSILDLAKAAQAETTATPKRSAFGSQKLRTRYTRCPLVDLNSAQTPEGVALEALRWQAQRNGLRGRPRRCSNPRSPRANRQPRSSRTLYETTATASAIWWTRNSSSSIE